MIGVANSRRISLLLLTALLLRAAIPDGYMPAAPDSGLLFELCPSGVPAGFMVALSGSDHHQHHGKSGASDAHYDASQCPIGHMLSSTITFDDSWHSGAVPQQPDFVAAPILILVSRVSISHRSRGPPA